MGGGVMTDSAHDAIYSRRVPEYRKAGWTRRFPSLGTKSSFENETAPARPRLHGGHSQVRRSAVQVHGQAVSSEGANRPR